MNIQTHIPRGHRHKVLLAFATIALAVGFAGGWSGLHPAESTAQLLPSPTGNNAVPMTSILPACDEAKTGTNVRPDCDFTEGNGDAKNTNPALCFLVSHAVVATVDEIDECTTVAKNVASTSNVITKAKTAKGKCYLVDTRVGAKVSPLSTCNFSKKCSLGAGVVCAATEPCMGTEQVFGALQYADQGEVQNCPAIQIGNDNIIWYDTDIPGDDGLIHPTIYRAKINPAQYDYAYKNGLDYTGKKGSIGAQIFYDAGTSGGDPRKTCNSPDGASGGTYDANPNAYDNSPDLNAIYVTWGNGGAVRSGQARVSAAYSAINGKAPAPPANFSQVQCSQNTGSYALITKNVNLIALAPDSPLFFASGTTASGGTPQMAGSRVLYDKIIAPDKKSGSNQGSAAVFTLDLGATSNNQSHKGGNGISGSYDLFVDGGDSKACASTIAVRIAGDPSKQQSWVDKSQYNNYTGEAYIFPMATSSSLVSTLDQGMVSETYQDLVKNDGSNVFADASSCSMASWQAYNTYGLATVETELSAMHGYSVGSDEQTSKTNDSVCFASGMGWGEQKSFHDNISNAMSDIDQAGQDWHYFNTDALSALPSQGFNEAFCNFQLVGTDSHAVPGIIDTPCSAGHGHSCYNLQAMRVSTHSGSSNHWDGQGSPVVYNNATVDPYFQLDPIGSGEADNGYKLVEKNPINANGVIPFWPVPPAHSNIATANAASPGNALNGDGSDDTTAPKINCNVSVLNPLSWFLCPLASGLESVAAGLDNAINSALNFNTDNLANYKEPFDQIRNLALGLIGVAALVAIVSQAADLQILDAYTIRKMLPRLFIVAIGISLAWPLLSWFINLTNDLGIGVRQLIYLGASHKGGTDLTGGGATAVENILAIGAIASLGFVGLLSFAATGALAAAVAYLVLIIRQMVIIVLVIFAPIGIACYMLPNTNKAWKFWWEAFSRALLMFPMISAFIAIGRVFASTVNNNLISFVAYFAPYFLIPLTFRLAGGVLGTLGGFVNDRSRGAFDGLKNFRGNRMKQRRQNAAHRVQGGNVFRNAPEKSIRGSLNRGIQTASMVRGGDIFHGTDALRGRVAERRTQHSVDAMAALKEDKAAQRVLSNDDYIQGALAGGRTKQDAINYLTSKGYSERDALAGAEAIESLRRTHGREIFEGAAAVANWGTGTGYQYEYDSDGNVVGGGSGQALADLNSVAGKDRALFATMYAEARGNAERARRGDLYGASFTTGFGIANDLLDEGNDNPAAIERARSRMLDDSLKKKSLRETLSGRNTGTKALMGGFIDDGADGETYVTGALHGKLAEASAKVDQARSAAVAVETNPAATAVQRKQAADTLKRAEHEQKRLYANIADAQDAVGSMSEENARDLGAFLGQEVDVPVYEYVQEAITKPDGTPAMDPNTGRQMTRPTGERRVVGTRKGTITEAIESLRPDSEFQQYRREYGTATAAAAAGAGGFGAAAGGAVVGPGSPGGPGGPGGPPAA